MMNPDAESTSPDQPRSVFLSFTSPDRETARAVVNGLKGADVDVWWDEGGIGWGDDWQTKLQQALDRCGAYVILLGSGGVRRWVKPELGVALKRHVDDGLPILPLLLDGVAPEALPPFLSLFQARPLGRGGRPQGRVNRDRAAPGWRVRDHRVALSCFGRSPVAGYT